MFQPSKNACVTGCLFHQLKNSDNQSEVTKSFTINHFDGMSNQNARKLKCAVREGTSRTLNRDRLRTIYVESNRTFKMLLRKGKQNNSGQIHGVYHISWQSGKIRSLNRIVEFISQMINDRQYITNTTEESARAIVDTHNY